MPRRIFLPRKKKRSPILSITSLVIANVLMLVLVGSRLATLNNHDLNILGFATDINITDLLSETNKQRQNNGIAALNYNPVLANAAEQKANDMFADDYWAHVAPDGKTPWDFIVGAGYSYSYAGENLAKDFSKSSSVVNAWMNSPTHKDNIVNPNYTEIGFAVVNGNLNGEETTLVVQMFGKPANSAVTKPPIESEPAVDIASLQTEEQVDLAVTKGDQLKAVDENPIIITDEAPTVFVQQTEPINNNLITVNTGYIKYFAYFLLITFSLSLVVDGVFAFRQKHLRITGNTVSHLVLFVAAILFLYYLNNPTVI
jgi:hypothetical protein